MGTTPTTSLTAADRIAAFACGFDNASLNQEALRQCARALLDTYAVAIAGRNEPAVHRALAYLRAGGMLAPDGGALPAAYPDAGLWGQAGRATIEGAALFNGITGHVLDYDDVTSPLRGHPSIAMLPAIMALGESLDASGQALAGAYTVGFEVICALSHAIAVDHYAAGWHSTSSIGMIGCTVACAHLLELDAAATVDAIGLAVSQASGTRANFGSDAKSFQAGHANAAGLRAALLAREGFTAQTGALDGRFGYVDLYAHGADLADSLAGLGVGSLALIDIGLDVKKYPLCYATHRVLDGLLTLRQEAGLSLDNVSRVDIRTSKGALTPLIHHRPQTGLQGKFSMEYAVAAALQDGAVTLASFTDSAVQRPLLQGFLERVRSDDNDNGPVFPRWALLTLSLSNGQVLERRVDTLRGSASSPLTDSELLAKVSDCLAWAGVDADAEGLMRAAYAMDEMSARELAAALKGGTARS